MNGIALLVTLSLGVDYSWRTTADRQQEYTIQIEPEVLKPLATGEQIYSDIPVEAGQIQRLCIRIGMTPATHTPAGEQAFKQLLVSATRVASLDRGQTLADPQTTILWPARSNPEQSFGVTYGWQPDQEGQQAYYVQIDPTLLRTLSTGDEIHATLDPAAGRVTRFIVSAGNKQLPQVAAPLAQAPLTPLSPTSTPSSRTRFNPSPEPASSLTIPPPASTKTGQFSTLPPETNSSRNSWGSTTPDYSRPAPTSTYGSTTAPLAPAGRDTYGYDPARSSFTDSPARGASTYGPAPYDNSLADNRSLAPLAPPANHHYDPVDRTRSSYTQGPDIAPVGSYQPAYQPTNPPAYQNAPYQPPLANQPPQLPQPTTRYSPPLPDNRVASLPPAPTTSFSPATNTPNGVFSPPAAQAPPDKPWGPLLFVTFALFFSIGGNLYLAYTALEFHNRYRSAIDRLRSAARGA